MFSFTLLCVCLISLVSGDSPRFNSRFSRQFERQEAAPYPPPDWRPSGPEFRIPEPQSSYGLPTQQNGPSEQEYGPPPAGPQSSYGPLPQQYGPPEQEYGPPPAEPTTTSEPELTTTELPTTTYNPDLEAEEVGSGDDTQQNEALTNEDRGVYYIYHPSGLLQRVNFATNDDVKNMEFSARLQYENVEPITEPIFTYDPVSFTFRKL
ncbi:hypothetical protein JTB14_008894 [Gonioctena quinquepunctata]|nr:hypothetical protein JTB14_008894 [Gonioctena quinquepunctata]